METGKLDAVNANPRMNLVDWERLEKLRLVLKSMGYNLQNLRIDEEDMHQTAVELTLIQRSVPNEVTITPRSDYYVHVAGDAVCGTDETREIAKRLMDFACSHGVRYSRSEEEIG